MSAIAKRYEELTILDTATHYAVEGKVSSRTRKYLNFFEMLMKFGRINESGFIEFHKRFAMEWVGDGHRNDLSVVNYVLEDIRKLTFVWRTTIPDKEYGTDTVILRGNPMTFSLTTERRGYIGVRFDDFFIKAIRNPGNEQIEILFAYTFLLAESDFAYRHVRLFSKIWYDEVKQQTELEEISATIDLGVYRQAIGAGELHPDIKNMMRKITKPSIDLINKRTKFEVVYRLENLSREAGKTRSKSTHITFVIRLKKSMQMEFNFDAVRLENLDRQMLEVVDFESLITTSPSESVIKSEDDSKVALSSIEYHDYRELTEVFESIRGFGIDEEIIERALELWKPKGLIDTWESFYQRYNNPKSERMKNPKGYLISLLKSGKGRGFTDAKSNLPTGITHQSDLIDEFNSQKQIYSRALRYLYYSKVYLSSVPDAEELINVYETDKDFIKYFSKYLSEQQDSNALIAQFRRNGLSLEAVRSAARTAVALFVDDKQLQRGLAWLGDEGAETGELAQAYEALKGSYTGANLDEVCAGLLRSPRPDFEKAVSKGFLKR